MDDAALQTVFRSVVIATLTYASSAWWGFATTTDRQRLQAFVRRSHRSRFVPQSVSPLDELCRASDDKLFGSITDNIKEHVLHELLPPQSVASQIDRTITYGRASITSNFPTKLVISQTSILSSACYFSIPTDVPPSRVFILFNSSIHLSFSHSLKYCTFCILTEFNKKYLMMMMMTMMMILDCTFCFLGCKKTGWTA